MFPGHTITADKQHDKIISYNLQLAAIDGLFGSVLAVDVDNSNAYTLTNQEFYKNCIFKIDDAAGAIGAITITVPSTSRPPFAVRNDSAQSVKVITEGQESTTTISPGGCLYYYINNGEAKRLGGASTAVAVADTTETTLTSAATSVNADYPATVDAGDLLIIIVTTLHGTTINTPAGYRRLQHGVASTSGDSAAAVFAKVAEGTEGGTTVALSVTGAATVWAVQVLRVINGVGGVAGVFTAIGTSEIDDTVDVPALSVDNPATEMLWIAAGGCIDDAGTVLTPPTDYNLLANTVADAGINASACTFTAIQNIHSNSEDPDNFTLSEIEGHIGFLIAVAAPLSEAHILQTKMSAILGGSGAGPSVSMVKCAAVLGTSSNGAGVSMSKLSIVLGPSANGAGISMIKLGAVI